MLCFFFCDISILLLLLFLVFAEDKHIFVCRFCFVRMAAVATTAAIFPLFLSAQQCLLSSSSCRLPFFCCLLFFFIRSFISRFLYFGRQTYRNTYNPFIGHSIADAASHVHRTAAVKSNAKYAPEERTNNVLFLFSLLLVFSLDFFRSKSFARRDHSRR